MECQMWSSELILFQLQKKIMRHQIRSQVVFSISVQECLLLSISDSWTFTSAQIHSSLSLVGPQIIKWVGSSKLQTRMQLIWILYLNTKLSVLGSLWLHQWSWWTWIGWGYLTQILLPGYSGDAVPVSFKKIGRLNSCQKILLLKINFLGNIGSGRPQQTQCFWKKV